MDGREQPADGGRKRGHAQDTAGRALRDRLGGLGTTLKSIDELNLPYLAAGATGLVSVVGNAFADRNAQLIGAVRGGDLDTARAVNAALHPLTEAIMRTSQGAIMAKAALAELGVIPHATVRLPLLESPPDHLRRLTDTLAPLVAGLVPA